MASVFVDKIAPMIVVAIAIVGIVHLFVLQIKSKQAEENAYHNPHGIHGPVETEADDDPYDVGINDKEIL